jgi:hypothetical protein
VRAILIIAVFLSACTQLLAQSLTARVNRNTVAVGEHFQVSFTIEGDADGFRPPSFEGFRVLSGPNKSSSMQWINGDFSSSVSYSYILMPEEEGQLEIGSAQLKNKSTDLSSDPIRINVVQGRQQARQPQQQPRQQQQANAPPANNSNDLSSHVFMKLFVDKKDAFVGEQIIATYKLYYDIEVGQAVPSMDAFNGFYTEDLEIDPNRSQSKERINGREYLVATMKQVVLTPQKTGELVVPSMELSLIARVPEQRRRRSIFDSFFGNYRNVRTTAKSNIEKINVSALPKSGQPADFSGAVGSYTMKANVDRTDVPTNEAVNLSVKLEGKGNLSLVRMPEVKVPADFESYDPKMRENITTDAGGTRGVKTEEYVMIPRFAGAFEIAPIRFSYFDPASKSYKQIETDPITINVEKGVGTSASGNEGIAISKKEDVQILGKDIRFIKTGDTELVRSEDRFFRTPLFYIVCALPFAGMLGAIFLFSFFRAQYGDERALRSKRAGSLAKKHLAKARKQMDASNEVFFEEISVALFGYLSDKLGIPTSSLNREQIESTLCTKAVSEDTLTTLNKALDECEMVRFAPGVVRSKQEMLAASESIIQSLEDEL